MPDPVNPLRQSIDPTNLSLKQQGSVPLLQPQLPLTDSLDSSNKEHSSSSKGCFASLCDLLASFFLWLFCMSKPKEEEDKTEERKSSEILTEPKGVRPSFGPLSSMLSSSSSHMPIEQTSSFLPPKDELQEKLLPVPAKQLGADTTQSLSPIFLESERARIKANRRLLKEWMSIAKENLEKFPHSQEWNLHPLKPFKTLDSNTKSYVFYRYRLTQLWQSWETAMEKFEEEETQNQQTYDALMATIQSSQDALRKHFTNIPQKLTVEEEAEMIDRFPATLFYF